MDNEIIEQENVVEDHPVRESLTSDTSEDKTEVIEEEFVKTYVCERKCITKGDQLCYSDIDDLELQRANEDLEGGSTNSELLLDTVRSGESLFKTFTFDANESSHDVEKCMAFWRLVLEKNLKPLKCTLVEPKTEEIAEPEEEVPVVKTISQELRELSPLWGEAWKEIQKKKLDKVKLTMRKKCTCCELLEKEKRGVQFESNDEFLNEIKALNNWIPDKNPLFKAEVVTESESSVEAPSLSPKSGKETLKSFRDSTGRKSTSLITFTTFSKEKLEKKCSSQLGTKPPENSTESLKDMCVCGCEQSKCVCDKLEAGDVTRCTCGCDIDKCMCERTAQIAIKCECSCGLDNCICIDYPEIIEEYCRCACGYDDCLCGEEASEEESLPKLRSTISVGVQCEDFGPKPEDETKGYYCIICGHFDCYCKVH